MDKQKRKKVLIINDPLQYGGSDLVAVRLQQHLDPDKFECVYCLRHDEIGPMESQVAQSGVRILHQPDNGVLLYKKLLFLQALVEERTFRYRTLSLTVL